MMAVSSPMVWGLALAAGLIVLATVSVLRPWWGQRDRADDLDPADAAFFRDQDRRRLWAGLVMFVIAAGMVLGLFVDPRADRVQAEAFVSVWVVVLILLCGLVGLALRDGWATRTFAQRHRRALIAEARALAEAERRLREAQTPLAPTTRRSRPQRDHDESLSGKPRRGGSE